MNIFRKVGIRILKLNPTRTAATIVGVILSAAMICAVTSFVASFQNYLLEIAIHSEGSWHGLTKNAEYADYISILADAEVESAVYTESIGYAEIDSKNEWKPYLFLSGLSDGAEDVLPIHVLEGRCPETTGEILIPEHLASNGGVHLAIGDTITLEIGSRMLDGYEMTQKDKCFVYQYDENGKQVSVHNEEALVIREVRTYTITGFYERLSYSIEGFSAPGYTALTLADPMPTHACDVYFNLHNSASIYDFRDKIGYNCETNRDVLLYSGISQYDGLPVVLTALSAIVIALIMFGSIVLIYNAFSMSVSERTRQFGLFASIGATRKQLRGMVLFEALCVSAIGIPLGILSGIGGIGITLLLIGDRFTALGAPIPMRLCVSPISVVIAAVVSLVTVLLSAWIPSARAARISAMEAIRQSRDIRTKEKPIKTSKITYTLFGLPGVLARKYYKRSRKKYRATVLSLFMSVVLFISAAAFTEYLVSAVTDGFSTPEYDLVYQLPYSQERDAPDKELLEAFEGAKSVTDVAYADTFFFLTSLPGEYLSKQYRDFASERASAASADNSDKTAEEFNAYLLFVDDASFAQLLRENDLDIAKFTDPNAPLAVAFDYIHGFDSTKGKILSFNLLNTDTFSLSFRREKAIEGYYTPGIQQDDAGNPIVPYYSDIDGEGSTLYLTLEEATETITLHAGAVLEEVPFYVVYDSLTLVYPESMRPILYPASSVVNGAAYYFASEDHAASFNALKQILSGRNLSTSSLYDHAESVEQERSVVMIIRVFAYGFTILISLIAAVNVFNTISTNVILRRREFAMLKSVGMTAKGFNRMQCYECLLYGSRALLYGLPAAIGMSFLIYRAFGSGYDFAYSPPWGAVCISVLSVFIVVFATMLYAMRKIKREDPIDALKNENL